MVTTGWGPAERGVVSSLTYGGNRQGSGPGERGVVSSLTHGGNRLGASTGSVSGTVLILQHAGF